MVDTEVAQGPATAARPRRRRWLTIWVIAPVLFLVLLGVARIVYWRASIHYAPLRPQGTGVPAPGQPVNVTSGPSGFVLAGATGTQQVLEFPVKIDGDHAVDIERIDPEDDAVVQVLWSGNLTKDGQRIITPFHALPVHVPRNATVNLELVVKKPDCSAGGPRYLSGTVTVHWHAMISPHTTELDLLRNDRTLVTLCPAG